MGGDKDRRREESALAASIRLSPIATILCDPQLPDVPIVAANEAFCALTGYAEREILGRNCRFLAGERTEPAQTERIRAAIGSLRPAVTELLNYRKDGSPFRNAVLIAPILNEAGEAEWFIGSQAEVGEGAEAPLSVRERKAAARIASLPARQRDVLREMASGARNKQIAWRLGLSEKTVKMHRALLLQRLALRTSADAIRLAVEAGL